MTIIRWIRNGFAYRDIKTCLERLRNKLEVIEHTVVPVAGSRKFVDDLDVDEMIESIGAILIDRRGNMFPEQYRWHDD